MKFALMPELTPLLLRGSCRAIWCHRGYFHWLIGVQLCFD